MPRTEIGLPQIEIEAPRVLANAMLYELDKVAAHHSGGDYARFMDDIDVGVDTLQQAKKVIRDIDLTLQTRQLRLNSSKTKILNFENGEIERHFCIKENKFLDFVGTVLESKPKSNAHIKKALLGAYTIWRGAPLTSPLKKDSRFFLGNGGKIFKRLVIMSAHVELKLLERDLLDIIWLDPGLRQYSFNALTRLDKPNFAFYKLKGWFQQGDFVDDQAVVHMALFIVHARFRKDVKFDRQIRQFVGWCMSHNSMVYTYSGFLIASKYLGRVDKLLHP